MWWTEYPVAVVPLLRKTFSDCHSPDLTSNDLKNRIGKNGISFRELILEISIPDNDKNRAYTGLWPDWNLKTSRAISSKLFSFICDKRFRKKNE